jgi:hypothetical protein
MAVDASGATFAPIFKGQTSADPEELVDLAVAGAEFHPGYLASHGGAWKDPFTGTRVGMTEGGDWTGVTEYWTAEPGAGGPSGMFTEGGARIGDPNVDPHITTDAEGMDPADLLERATALSLASTFLYDRQAVADKYGITGEDIAGMGEHVKALGLSGSGVVGQVGADATFNMETAPEFDIDASIEANQAAAQTAGYVDVPAGGGTEGLAELARAAAPSPGMSPYEILAQTIELAATFGDLPGVAPGYEGNLTVNEVNGWINAIQQAGDNDWGMVEEIRNNVLQYRVTPARVAETYGITVEEAEMLTGEGGDIKAFLDSGKTEIVNRNTGAVTTIGSGSTDGGPTSTELQSATDIVRNVLEDYGLGELLDDPDLDLINLWLAAGGDAAGAAAVWARVRQSDPYKDRFPGMAALSEAGRAISEATYIEMERGYIEIMNAADIDPGFYDEPSDFGALIGGDVSVNEFNQRVALAVEATTRMTSEVREELATYYPEVTDGDLTAYYLDPERATNIFEEREKIGAARIGGIAVETGFGSVSRQTAERLRAAGVTETAARRGFQAIAPSTLAEETASESLDRDPVTGRPMASLAVVGQQKSGNITPEELVGAEFGTDPQAARRIEARRQRRLAAFAQRGGPAMTGGGYTGLGTAT